MKKIIKISHAIDRFFDYMLYLPILMLGTLIMICLFMVTLRQVFIGAFNWADEAMRFLLVYTSFLTLPTLVSKGRNISVDIIDVLFPHKPKARRFFRVTADVLVLAFLLVMIFPCITFIKANLTGYSPAMRIPLYLVYLCIPIGFSFSILACANNILKRFMEE
ncbi:MAG: TRAP transporter small permease [Oscillospiraceae bacterium]